MEEKKYIRNTKTAVIGAAGILFLLLIYLWLNSVYGREWKEHQDDFRQLTQQINDSLGLDNVLLAEIGIYEVRLPQLNAVDRCISCHNGLENPLMENVPQPHSSHPGNYLHHHPVSDYGCTVCHAGQGRAMDKKNAHGLDRDTHWPRPLLEDDWIQASCGKCHLAVFNPVDYFDETGTFIHGQEIFSREGCLGCHKARGVGGILGPDLTEQGEKTRHEYDFQNITGEKSVSNWLKQHFKDPEMVSPGSQMLRIDLPDSELEALATFVLGLAKPDIPLDYFSIEMLGELKGIREFLEGEKIFPYTCSSCHGKNGEGKDYENYETGVPSVMNADFLRVASLEFIYFTLLKGRSNKQMASWEPSISGFTRDEINDLSQFLDAKDLIKWEVEDIIRNRGNLGKGEEIFLNNCSTCHGTEGQGGLAVAINQKDFLEKASDLFILKTLAKGRVNTAMPSWSNLESDDITNLMTFLRSWYPGSVYPTQFNLPNGDYKEGEIQYHYNCSRCHGVNGEANTGPSVINKDFLNAASDYFIYKTIAEGRAHTSMFGWSEDLNKLERLDISDISNIISFMKGKASMLPDYIYTGSNPGNPVSGEELFEKHCSECHGTHGEGIIAPALNNQEFLSAASNGYLLATITIGRKGTKMPSWGYESEEYPLLGAKEREDITAFIRSWQRIHIGF